MTSPSFEYKEKEIVQEKKIIVWFLTSMFVLWTFKYLDAQETKNGVFQSLFWLTGPCGFALSFIGGSSLVVFAFSSVKS